MKLFIYVMTISFLGISLQAGVMPEETSNSVLQTVIGFNDTQIDYSSDVVEPAPSFKEKVADLLHFTFMSIFLTNSSIAKDFVHLKKPFEPYF